MEVREGRGDGQHSDIKLPIGRDCPCPSNEYYDNLVHYGSTFSDFSGFLPPDLPVSLFSYSSPFSFLSPFCLYPYCFSFFLLFSVLVVIHFLLLLPVLFSASSKSRLAYNEQCISFLLETQQGTV